MMNMFTSSFCNVTIVLLLLTITFTRASNDLCEVGPPSDTSDCVDIQNDWNLLRDAMEDDSPSSDQTVVFCPFHVVVLNTQEPPLRPRAGAFACLTADECAIEAGDGGSQLMVVDIQQDLTLWGFGFSQVTQETAVHVRKAVVARFCRCTFHDNYIPTRRGAALRSDLNVHVWISHSKFSNNRASRGGALYNRGNMTLMSNQFEGNEANRGGAIGFESDAIVTIQGNAFGPLANQANSGPILYSEIASSQLTHHYRDMGGNQVLFNVSPTMEGCTGLLNRLSTDTCLQFDIADIQTPSPALSSITSMPLPTNTLLPTTPTVQPTLLPSLPPTLAPSTEPSLPRSPFPSSDPSVNPAPTPYLSTTPSSTPSSSVYAPPKDPQSVNLLPLVSRSKPNGYFNFNMKDSDFGPNAWYTIQGYNEEFARYDGLNLTNECGDDRKQSPIDLSFTTSACREFHQIRARGGDWKNLTKEEEIIFQVLPTHLRIQINSANLNGPSADSPGGFAKLYTDHVEIATPSLHTLDGRRYDAEYSVYHVQERLNRILILSVLVDARSNQYNNEFQKVLNAFALVEECGLKNGRRLKFDDLETHSVSKQSWKMPSMNERLLSEAATIDGKFNLFNIEMVPSIYWWAYKGSLPRPPCSSIANWRVVDTPMQISQLQLDHLKEILIQGPCHTSREGLDETMARPLQGSSGNRIWRCTRDNFLSDCERFSTLCPSPDFP